MHNLNKDYSLLSQSDGIDIHTTDESFIPRGRSVSAINGAGWIDQAVKMVGKQPKAWLIVMAIIVAIDFVSTFILEKSPSLILPISITMQVVDTMLFAGIILIAESQRLTTTADLNQLGNGFSRRAGGIIALLCTQFGFILIVIMLMFFMVGGGLGSIGYFQQLSYAAQTGNDDLLMQALGAIGIGSILFACLLGFVLLIIMQMLTCFAIPLMFIQQVSFSQSLSMSFAASIKNILPALVYFICIIVVFGGIAFIMSFFPSLDILLTIFVISISVPLVQLATYIAYRDIFTNKA